MKTPFAKTRLILSATVFIVGTVYVLAANDILQIPTTPADHKATLVEVQLGMEWGEQWIRMGQNREVFITGGLIAGEVATNRALAPNSTIGGGYKSNTINAAGDNSTIAAGEQNTINSKNSFIGAGRENIIEQNAEWALIAAGLANKISAPFSSIAGGQNNTISAAYSVIPGGSNNEIKEGAAYSFVAGSYGIASGQGTFIWSDDDSSYRLSSSPRYSSDIGKRWKFISAKPNTFLIRSLNGMSINTPDAIPGVNVNIAGPVQIKSEGLLGTKCEKEFGMQFSGTYEYSDGCMYFCDGKYWQLLNITNPSNVARCGEDSQYKENIAYTFCYLYLDLSEEKPYQMEFRAGDSVEAYKAYASNSCESAANKQKITCQQDGTRYPKGFEYINCTPWIVYP